MINGEADATLMRGGFKEFECLDSAAPGRDAHELARVRTCDNTSIALYHLAAMQELANELGLAGGRSVYPSDQRAA